MSMESLVARTSQAEQQVEELLTQLDQLQRAHPDVGKEPPSELQELRKENQKLKYRLNILKRATEAEEKAQARPKQAAQPKMARVEGRSMSTVHLLTSVFRQALDQAFPDLPDAPCPVVLSAMQGDYQFNGAMPIAGLLKAQGVKMAPRDVAAKVLSCLDGSSCDDVIERTEVAGPGFVNIFLKASYVRRELQGLLRDEVRPPVLPGGPKRVLVDFSAPNIAKEMHVGHLRSTIIGDSISNLLDYLGHSVLRINHVGDWGTQFGMLIAHLQDIYPDYLTRSPPISDLMSFYKQSKVRFDGDADFKKRAYESVVRLQAHEQDYIHAWNLICDVSRAEFQKIYDRLGIRNLTERGESFYQEHMKAVVKRLEKQGLLEDDDGRKIMFAPGVQIPLTIVKSDGGYTYDTSDMAALYQRINDENVDWIVYTTDAGQATHFQSVFACGRRANILTDAVRVDHVGFGVVLGEDKKKFKTRSGDTVRLADLLDEGLKRSKEKLLEKERDQVLSAEEFEAAMTSVAYGCIKYADLVHNRNHEYVFSFDKMLEDKGNTAVYMLYAYTRICSIARTANLGPADIARAVADDTPLSLDHKKEVKLGKLLLRFPETILKIADDLFLHSLCEYMYEVATTFTEFYDNCYCVEKNKAGEVVNVNMGRVLLCDLTAKVLKKCFAILGLTPVQRM